MKGIRRDNDEVKNIIILAIWTIIYSILCVGTVNPVFCMPQCVLDRINVKHQSIKSWYLWSVPTKEIEQGLGYKFAMV